MPRQLRLPLDRPAFRHRRDFIVSAVNCDAVRTLDAWPGWHGGVLALVGPAGSGKSHLAQDWARQIGARVLETPPAEPLTSGAVLVEDADRTLDSETLFHLFNAAGADGLSLLLTARTPPKLWSCTLPDLRSRLNAMAVAELSPPDDPVLAGVLRKLFRERHISPSDDLIEYLLKRMERSVPAAQTVVERLDEAGDAQGREINRTLARKVLDTPPASLNLFES